MKELSIDWAQLLTPQDFYAAVLEQMEAPHWHGENLDALRDSWVSGGVCPTGPRYSFSFRNEASLTGDMVEFSLSVLEIAEESVREHRGVLRRS